MNILLKFLAEFVSGNRLNWQPATGHATDTIHSNVIQLFERDWGWNANNPLKERCIIFGQPRSHVAKSQL